jgi:hypothetical protein
MVLITGSNGGSPAALTFSNYLSRRFSAGASSPSHIFFDKGQVHVVLQRSCLQDEDRTLSFINFNDVL